MSKGRLVSYFGPMYAGKSTALINHVENNLITSYIAFKPKIDNRYSYDKIQTHDGKNLPCLAIESSDEIKADNINFVIIDEIQFFDGNIVTGNIMSKIDTLLNSGINVIVGGLDKDWKGNFFPISQKIIRESDDFIYLNAKCFCCGGKAEFSYKKIVDNTVVSVGGSEMYEARCIKCWNSRKVA